ncbi:MAG: hypothetical protein M0Z73_05235 [Betaproteobacteria bacterium]|nr:hypothetical protein [Betaproteobacteria bacterium]
MRRTTRIPPQPPRLARYAEKLQRDNLAAVARPEVWHGIRDNCFAPGGIYDRLGPAAVTSYYRVAEITHPGNRDNLPLLIDHHAAIAYYDLLCLATNPVPFCVRNVNGLDSPKTLARLTARFLQNSRPRFDPVLEGLHEEIDPLGHYEARFMGIQADWNEEMQVAYALTSTGASRYQNRLQLCRQAAKELLADLLEWFDDLRGDVCGGGSSGWWIRGDELREKID